VTRRFTTHPVRGFFSTAAVACALAALALAGCGGGGGAGSVMPASPATASPTPATTAAPGAALPNYAANVASTAAWIAADAQLPDGAIVDSGTQISPYFANRAAIGLALAGGHTTAVQAWMQWYIAHLNATDVWGGSGTIYDYTVAGGVETSTGTADSTDAYAGTFLSLASTFYQTGGATAQTYVRSIRAQLAQVAGVLTTGQQTDGLTWALPTYQIKYLMDNCEVYAGLRDYGTLLAALGDTADAATFAARAQASANGISSELWNASADAYNNAIGVGNVATPVDWTNYESAAAELFPVLFGVITPTSSQAVAAYAKFNAAFTKWDALDIPDEYPWTLVSTAAILMNDAARANAYIGAVDGAYVATGYPYPWYDAEGGWFVQSNALLAAQTSTAGARRVTARTRMLVGP
jgi:hypothetical protein